MNKNIKIALCLSLLLVGKVVSYAQTKINGVIKGCKDTTLYVTYVDEEGYKRENVSVRNGKFVWNIPISFPTKVGFAFTEKFGFEDSNVASMWTEPKKLELFLNAKDLGHYNLKGSKLNEQVSVFEETLTPHKKRIIEILTAAESSNQNVDKLLQEFKAEQTQLANKRVQYLKENPDSYYSAAILYDSKEFVGKKEFGEYYDLLKGNAKNSNYGKALKFIVEGVRSGVEGGKVPVFSKTDINDKPFNMSDYIGKKYILLDFWASWCVPCRQSNPHLKGLHDKYKADGLEVICVSDDDGNAEAWRKAVKSDQIEQFIHIIRGYNGIENFLSNSNDVNLKFDVSILPTKILIGKDGIVLGRYESSTTQSELDAKLKQVFGH